MPCTEKAYWRGTQRRISPADTLARVRPLLRRLGITRIADVTGLDSIGIPVVMVCRPNARSISVSQGKGLDLEAARASGVMESIEQWHAEHILRPMVFGTAAELAATRRLVDLAGLPRLAIGAFQPHRKLLWLDGVDLFDGAPRALPLEVVTTDYTSPRPPGSGCFLTTSTGLASGNDALEATLHGLYEVIERDAVAIWRAGGAEVRRRTRIALDTVDDLDCRALLRRFERAGVAVGAWDATSDIGLPVVVAEIADRDPDPCHALCVSGGQGCHRSRAIALARALTEAAQSRLTAISGARDDIVEPSLQRVREADRIAAALAELEAPAARSFAELPDAVSDSFDDDLAAVLGALRGAGLAQAVAVDLSRPELGVAVVRVVVPGLESMWNAPGYAPGPRAQRARPS
ncbi:YcaO-like family protein [Sorangium sp. So ce145]|uniref:YcaO-like family protein n=1 Tax=Sorangium sp. So ce145 TaxID=3133285 RepID=UPI003F5DE3CB